MKTKQELRLKFENGDRPNQEHFWEWQDSYWHKDEKIDMAKIAGLENGLPRLNDYYAEIDESGNASFAHLQVRRIFIKPGTLYIPDRFAVAMGVSELTLPDSLLTIGTDAFNTNPIESLTLPEQLTSIGERAFISNQLTSLAIPPNVREIKESAFADNKLTSLFIPASVSIIRPQAFNYNPNLSTVILDKATQYYSDAFDSKTKVIGGTLISDM